MDKLDQNALKCIFLEARTHSAWQNKEVSDDLLAEIYDLAKMAPNSANGNPMRIVFIKSASAKQRLKPFLIEKNIAKTMAAPVTAILAYDLEFYEHLDQLSPHNNAKSWFVGNKQLIQDTAFRNGSLQGAYFMIAARALGLDVGPMSGFDQLKLDQEFFADGKIKSNFLCNLGYGDPEALFPRNPRFNFNQIAQIL